MGTAIAPGSKPMAQTLIMQTTLEALAGLATEDRVRCERIVVSDRLEAIAMVGVVPIGDCFVQVQALIILPGDEDDDLGFTAVASDLEVAFQPCLGA